LALASIKASNIRLADGGYIAWRYGASIGTQRDWIGGAWTDHSRHTGTIILRDSEYGYREELMSTYKARRREKIIVDKTKADKRRLVKDFERDHITFNEKLITLAWRGLEADDLVSLFALHYLRSHKTRVAGMDKDLLQLPTTELHLVGNGGRPRTIESFAAHLPVSVRPYVRRHRDILLCLVLLGDKSDSVNRLLPQRSFATMIELLHEARPFEQACRLFGSDVATNLYLTVLPGPWVFSTLPTAADVVYLVDRGEWWTDAALYSGSLDPRLDAACRATVAELSGDLAW
jgi:hypothetical protein